MKYDAIIAQHNARRAVAYRRAASAAGIAIAKSVDETTVSALFARDEARLAEVKAEVDRTFAGGSDVAEMDAAMPIPKSTSARDTGAPVEGQWNIWIWLDETGERCLLVGSQASRSLAEAEGRRLGATQIQYGSGGEVVNL